MRKLVLAAALAMACASVIAPLTAAAQGYSRAAQRVLSQARAASGGAGWNLLRGWHETGHMGDTPYEAWLDPLRYGLRVEVQDALGKHVQGFNGQGDWQILSSGATLTPDDPAALARTRAQAFFSADGFFFPGRFDARGDVVGVRQYHGRAFDVVNVKPWGANPRELWFDRRTHLLARMVDRMGSRPRSVELSDYRKVGPIRVAFRIVSDDPADSASLDQRRVDSLVFTPADRALFSLPRPLAPAPAATNITPPRP